MANAATQGRPRRLKKPPVVEVAWELRYFATPADVELLPGCLYELISAQYPRREVLLPQTPDEHLLAHIPEAAYLPTTAFTSEADNFSVLIGTRNLCLSSRGLYTGWTSFRQRLGQLLDQWQKCVLPLKATVCVLRYVNFLQLDQPPSLEGLALELRIAGEILKKRPMELLVEFPHPLGKQLAHVATPAEFTLAGSEPQAGTLLAVSAIGECKAAQDASTLLRQADQLHEMCEDLFYRMIDRKALDSFDPVYTETDNEEGHGA